MGRDGKRENESENSEVARTKRTQILSHKREMAKL